MVFAGIANSKRHIQSLCSSVDFSGLMLGNKLSLYMLEQRWILISCKTGLEQRPSPLVLRHSWASFPSVWGPARWRFLFCASRNKFFIDVQLYFPRVCFRRYFLLSHFPFWISFGVNSVLKKKPLKIQLHQCPFPDPSFLEHDNILLNEAPSRFITWVMKGTSVKWFDISSSNMLLPVSVAIWSRS